MQPPRGGDVLRVGVDLVQIDATVTDARGRHVTDLSAEDFEVYQDGRLQRVTTFAYVRGSSPRENAAHLPTAPVRARPLAPDQVRRTIAIIVDDLGLSFESMARARDVLRAFVDKQMQPGDLVAIIRTGAGSGALQQFTSDRRVLDAAIERVRWNFMSRASPFSAAGGLDWFEAQRNEHFTAGTLGAIHYVIRGVGELPGRKSVIVLSDGFRLMDAEGHPGRVLDDLHRLVDAANRAGVVIYTVDTRGLTAAGPLASDTAPDAADARKEELLATQDGLGYLAAETGGLFLRNNNDLTGGVQRALDDQQGYYLIGYTPARETFASPRPRFHKISVRVKRAGLRVRSRRGFLGISDRAAPPATPANRMIGAVMSPFAAGDIRLRLSSYFGQVEKIGAVVLSVMHIDARDLTFTRQQGDGSHTAEVETLAVTFDEHGAVADQNSRRFTVTLTDEALARAMKAGFVYRMRVPLKRAGPYQLRIALRDVAGDRIGSASQFLEIPDVRKGRLTLSGLVIDGSKSGTPSNADNVVDDADPRATVALRMFPQGSDAAYFCEIYNAKPGRDGRLQLESETRLYRDGVEVFKGTPRPVTRAADGRVMTGGLLTFPAAMAAGEYILEVIVTDKAPKKPVRLTRTIDFEIVPR